MSSINFYSSIKSIFDNCQTATASIENIRQQAIELQKSDPSDEVTQQINGFSDSIRQTHEKTHAFALSLLKKEFQKIQNSNDDVITKRCRLNEFGNTFKLFKVVSVSLESQNAIAEFRSEVKKCKKDLYERIFKKGIADPNDPSSRLPSEVFNYIMNMIPQDQKNCNLVCTQWNQRLNQKIIIDLKEIREKVGPSLYDQKMEELFKDRISYQSPKKIRKELSNWAKNFIEICKIVRKDDTYTNERLSFLDIQAISQKENTILKAFEIKHWIQNNPQIVKKSLHISNWQEHGPQSFDQIPSEISEFSNVQSLAISKGLRFLSPDLAKLKNLRYINLQGINIAFPKYLLKNWTSLETLYLWRFTSVPFEEIKDLTKLSHLSLTDCGISTFPNEILNLKKLRILKLENNPLKEIPKQLFSELKGLEQESVKHLKEKFSII